MFVSLEGRAAMSPDTTSINLRVSTVDAVADQLRRELLHGTIVPGARILPNELATRFSVSHIPVREALRRLEAEGLVVTSPQRATYAADIGLDDMAGIYELRRILEGELAWRSARVRTAEDTGRVRDAWESLTGEDPYSDPFFAAHREFHWKLMAPAASSVTRRVLDPIWLGVDRYVAVASAQAGSILTGNRLEETMQEHRGLVEAFEEGDADELRSRLATHLTRTEDRLRENYRDVLSGSQEFSEWLQASVE